MFEFVRNKLTHISWTNMPAFLVTWLMFVAAAAISYLYQYYRHRQQIGFVAFLSYAFPFSGWKSMSSIMDMVIYCTARLTRDFLCRTGDIITIALATALGALLASIFPLHVAQPTTVLTLVVCTLVIFVVRDFASFASHYMQHKIPCLWELHKVHHSATFMTPLTRYRIHPLAEQLDSIFSAVVTSVPTGLIVFMFQLSFVETIALLALPVMLCNVITLDCLRHSQFPVSFGWFDRIFVSPHMHQLHHSTKVEHWDRNMGQSLSIWDWMFGVATIPTRGEVLNYGLGRGREADKAFENPYGIYVRPVVRMVLVLFDSSRTDPRPGTAGAAENAESDVLAITEAGQGRLPNVARISPPGMGPRGRGRTPVHELGPPIG